MNPSDSGRRAVVVAFAVIASVLVTTAPVAGSHQLATVSIHTSDTDFNAGTLTNTTVIGSGNDATVRIDYGAAGTFYDGFENESADSGVPESWEAVDTPEDISVVTSFAHTGSQSVQIIDGSEAGVDSIRPTEQPYASTRTAENVSVAMRVRADDFPNQTRLTLHENDTQIFLIAMRNGNLQSNNGSSWNTISNTPDSQEWVEVTVTNVDPAANTAHVVWEVSGASGEADIDSFNAITSGWDEARIEANSEGGQFDHYHVGDTATEGTYLSANHTAEDTEQGFVNLTRNSNATVDVLFEGWDGSTWNTLNQTTGITATGNQTFTWAESSTTKVRLNVTINDDSSGFGEPDITLDDEGVQFTAADPVVDNSSASPTGDLSTATPTLEIDINDSDFPLSQGDSVDVEFFVDGSSEGTKTLTTNGTASLTTSALTGGDHTWHVVATDEFSHSVTSQTFSISTPGNVTFRREQPEHPIIDDRQINVTIYGEADGDQFVQNSTTTDGNVSLTDVPVDERLVVVATADGFHQREVVITDIFDQTDMYLLNTSESSVEITFDIQDTTGEFSKSDTEFIIERSINRSLFDSGGFTQEAIAGDRLGAVTEYTADLKQDQRYTVVIRNPGGDTRTLGAQVAKSNGTVPIRITSIDLEANETQGFNWSAATIESGGNEFVEVEYVDEEDLTTSVDIVIFEFGNEGNEIHNQTHTGTFGTLRVTEQLTGDDVNKTWAVQIDATRDGEVESGTIVVGRDTNPLSVPLDDEWKYRISLLSLILVGFVVGGGVSPEVGSIGIVCAAGMWFYVEWMPAEVTAVAIGFGAITAVGFALGTRGGEPVQ